MSTLWFESALDNALRADICCQRLAALQGEYAPKRDAFDRYLHRNGPYVECPEFYVDDFRILSCAMETFAKRADDGWELWRHEDEDEGVVA